MEFIINGTLPLGAPGGLWVTISCGGAIDCYSFANTSPREGTGPSNPNTRIVDIPTTTTTNDSDGKGAWHTEGGMQTITLPFLVTTRDDNCKKRGAARYIQVNIQVTQNGGGSQKGSVRITIADDDQDATDPLYGLTFLKPECTDEFSI